MAILAAISEQIIHTPRMITNIQQIEQLVGKTVVAFNSEKGEVAQYRISSEPFAGREGLWIQVEVLGRKNQSKKISLADNGIIPYDVSGKWNPWNWLEEKSK